MPQADDQWVLTLIYDQVPDRGFVLRHSVVRNPAYPHRDFDG